MVLFSLMSPLKPYNMSKNMFKEVDRMPRMVKKTIELDQDYIDTARRIFAVRTEKEAVNKALEMVIIDNQIIETHESLGGKGELIEDVFK
jgi:Arc/MetJ family transcription regulator